MPPTFKNGILKIWGAICVIQTLYTSGIIWELSVPSSLYGTVLGVGIMAAVGILSVSQCVRVTQVVSKFLSEGIAPCVATYSMCQ